MRRWFAGCIVVFVLVLALFGGSGAALAYFQPAAPGDALYSIQNRVTQVWIRAHPERSRARLALQHLARHAVWLEKAAGTPREEAALRAYDQALRFTAQHLMKVPEKEWPTYRAQWVRLNQQALNALSHFIFVPRQQPTLWQQAKAKMEAVLESAQSQSRQGARGILDAVQVPLPAPTQGEAGQPETAPQPQTTATPWTTPMPVAFPTEFVQTHQQFFPLTGAHATLACTSCHAGGRFAGTDDTCQACHAQDRPPNHFQGQCSSCHATTAWRPARFDHTFPLNHGGANGACSVCHPNGADTYTCEACHSMNQLLREHQEEGIFDFAGRCTQCHLTGKADEHENDREDLDERGKGREEGLEKDHENDREDEDEHEDEDDHSFRGNQNIAFASDARGDFVSSGLLTTNLLLVGGLWASALTSLRRR